MHFGEFLVVKTLLVAAIFCVEKSVEIVAQAK